MNKKIISVITGSIFVLALVAGTMVFTNKSAYASSVVKENTSVSENKDKEDANLAQVKTKISKEEAALAAQKSVGAGEVLNVELEDENGTIVYGVNIKASNRIHDIKVDSNTGKILKDELDNDKYNGTDNEVDK